MTGKARWTSTTRCVLAYVTALFVCAAGSIAQTNSCWLPGDPLPGIDGDVFASCAWDPDGPGALDELILFGGTFTTAGTRVVSGVVAWDGLDWVTLGNGLPGRVTSIVTFEGSPVASVAELSDGVVVHYVARWDGDQWQQLGSMFSDGVEALCVYDGQLLAAGWFTQVGAAQARGLAKWDGKDWTEFGGGVAPQSSGFLTPVEALHVHDGSLYIGGSFGFAGGTPARNIARWDGSSWHALGTGTNGTVYDITTHAGHIFVGGIFSTAGGLQAQAVALWNGSMWTSPGGGIIATNSAALAVASFQGELYAGGIMHSPPLDIHRFVKWNGSVWGSPGGGVGDRVRMLAAIGDYLYVGGMFNTAGDTGSNGISRWDGASWLPFEFGINDEVHAVERFDDTIIIGGRFSQAGEAQALNVAQRVDNKWLPLGGGIDGEVFDLHLFRDDLIACGFFRHAGGTESKSIARWDGEVWHPLGGGFNQNALAYAMTTFHGDLIVCGQISSAGGVPVQRIARWDGHAWHPMGTGANAFPGTPLALTVYRGKLFAGGGGSKAVVARWTGQRWQELEGLAQPGANSEVKALATYQGDLIAAGRFRRPRGIDGRDIARWDGRNWHSMGSGAGIGLGAGGQIWSLAVVGADLIAGGVFRDMDSLAANSIARWDGATWHAMGEGVRGGSPRVRQMQKLGHTLYVVGGFTIADEQVSAHLARWRIGGPCSADIAPAEPDGRVGVDDLIVVLVSWGCTATVEPCAADIDKSASVDVDDLLAVILDWGDCDD